MDCHFAKERGGLVGNPFVSQFKVVLIHLEAHTIATRLRGSNRRRAAAQERIKYSITNETEHPYQALCQFHRVWGRMIAC